MNGIVACTLTKVSTKKSCIIRIWRDYNAPGWGPNGGRWDIIGGDFKFSTVESGLWAYDPPSKQLTIQTQPNLYFPYSGFFLSNVPHNFLDTAPGNSIQGLGSFLFSGDLTWSIWYRTAPL